MINKIKENRFLIKLIFLMLLTFLYNYEFLFEKKFINKEALITDIKPFNKIYTYTLKIDGINYSISLKSNDYKINDKIYITYSIGAITKSIINFKINDTKTKY